MNTVNDAITKWIEGIPYEVAFWNNVYRWKHTRNGALAWSNFGKEIKLDGFDASAFLREHTNPLVIDVGCGMSYAPGNYLVESGKLMPININYVDPLASYFNNIREKYRPDIPVITFGMMEFLSAFYEANSVALVIIQNALDHSADPMKGIYEALAILCDGGVLYLNHHPNEAVVERYKGFHQYNVMNETGKLIIWREDCRWDVAKELDGIATVEVSDAADGHVIAIIRKISPVPECLLTAKADKRRLCEVIIAHQMTTMGVWRGLRPSLNYWKYNVVQFFIQALPWKLKMGLKHWLKR